MPKVVNKRNKDWKTPNVVEVDRTSKWGNPFIMKGNSQKERTRVIGLFTRYIQSNQQLLDQIHELKGKDLACWCAPHACHADVLMFLANPQEKHKESKHMISQKTRKLLIISKIKWVGKRNLTELATDPRVFALEPKDWHSEIEKLKEFHPSSPDYSAALALAEKDITTAEFYGDKIISIFDNTYPELLLGIKSPPVILYVRGDLSKFTKKAITIVGTREPTKHGEIIAERVTSFYSKRGWQIVSGLAIGIDTIAHETALACGASTIAVLAHGLETVYPRKNENLAHRIVDNGGLLVSEYAYNSEIYPGFFIERDKIQAALGKAVIIIQTDITGGSWHAGREVLKIERHLAIPIPTTLDNANEEPKVEGNRILSFSSDSEKKRLLRCSDSDLNRLLIFNSKLDYHNLEEIILKDK